MREPIPIDATIWAPGAALLALFLAFGFAFGWAFALYSRPTEGSPNVCTLPLR